MKLLPTNEFPKGTYVDTRTSKANANFIVFNYLVEQGFKEEVMMEKELQAFMEYIKNLHQVKVL